MWVRLWVDFFGAFPSNPQKRNEGHEETETPDLYRVKARVTITYSNLQICGRPPNSCKDL